MKSIVTAFLSLSTFSSLVLAQSVVDVEELRKSITSNSKFSSLVEEPSVDAKLKELAEKEKNLETRIAAQPEEQEIKQAEDLTVSKPIKAQDIIPQPQNSESKAEVKLVTKSNEQAEVKAPVEEKKPVAIVQVADKKSEQQPQQDKELANAKAKIAKLSKELDETRSRLIIAETEVERLNASIEQRNRDSLRAMNVTSSPPRARINPAEIEPLHNNDEAPVIGDKMTSSIPVATVIVQKLSLKVGPNASSSTLMHVNEGTRLPIEGSQGGWYRVVAPSGARAWIPAAGVTIGGG